MNRPRQAHGLHLMWPMRLTASSSAAQFAGDRDEAPKLTVFLRDRAPELERPVAGPAHHGRRRRDVQARTIDQTIGWRVGRQWYPDSSPLRAIVSPKLK